MVAVHAEFDQYPIDQCWCHHSHYCGIGLPANYHHTSCRKPCTFHCHLPLLDQVLNQPVQVTWITESVWSSFFVDRSNYLFSFLRVKGERTRPTWLRRSASLPRASPPPWTRRRLQPSVVAVVLQLQLSAVVRQHWRMGRLRQRGGRLLQLETSALFRLLTQTYFHEPFDLDFWHEGRRWLWLAWDCRSRL